MLLLRFFMVTIFALSPIFSVRAGTDLMRPSGAAILTSSSQISKMNRAKATQFDLDMLRFVDDSPISASTVWTLDQQTFGAISLNALLDYIGGGDHVVNANVANDFTILIPVAQGPIIAYS